MYQLINDKTTGLAAHCILRVADGAVIPMDNSNDDYRAYLAWVAAGNTPEAAA